MTYTTVQVSGTVDPEDHETFYAFETSTDGANWSGFTYLGPLAAGAGVKNVSTELTGLKPGTEYQLRLNAQNFIDEPVNSAEPNPTFTTPALPNPTVTINTPTAVTATGASFSGTIDPEAPGGNPAASDVSWHFECTPECPGLEGTIPADSASHEVTGTATGLKINTDYEVKLVASNANGPTDSAVKTFKTDPTGPGAVTLPALALVDGTRILAGGKVNANNSPTQFWVEYGLDDSYGTSAPLTEDGDAGSGEGPQFVVTEVKGLQPETTYHLRLVAKNATGTVEGNDVTVTTASSDDGKGRFELPSNRVWEQVSPVDKNGADVYKGGGVVAADGNTTTFKSQGSFAGQPTSKAGITTDYLSRRTATKWVTEGITPGGTVLAFEYNWRGFSEDFTRGYYDGDLFGTTSLDPTVATEPVPPAESSQTRRIMYEKDFTTGKFHTINGTVLPGNFNRAGYLGATPDMTHIFISSERKLVPNSPCESPIVNDIFAPHIPPCVYERTNGSLRLASILPGETPSSGDFAGVTDDGSDVFFRNGGKVYRRTDGSSSIEVGASERTTPPVVPGGETRVGALDKGTGDRVALISSVELVDEDKDETNDLYLWDGTQPVGSRLTLIRGDLAPGDPAEIDSVLAASSDLSRVYFRSEKRQLVDGEPNEPGFKNYLYEDGEITFLGTGGIGEVRQSPDARYIGFISSDRIDRRRQRGHLPGVPLRRGAERTQLRLLQPERRGEHHLGRVQPRLRRDQPGLRNEERLHRAALSSSRPARPWSRKTPTARPTSTST